jgi:DNA-binding GntR family transcriptional regulator
MDLLATEHPEEATEVGHKFHRQLAVVANNPRCDEVVGRVHRQLERYWALTVLKDAPRRQVAVGEHRDVIEALAAGDPDRAEAVMRTHIAAGSANVVEGVRRYLEEVRQREAVAG